MTRLMVLWLLDLPHFLRLREIPLKSRCRVWWAYRPIWREYKKWRKP